MKTKYVCHGPISPRANFSVNRLVGRAILLVKKYRWGKRKKRPILLSISKINDSEQAK